MTLQVRGSQYEQLMKALTKAFPTRSKLERMLQFRLGRALNEIAGENLDLLDAAFKVIESANAEGWTLKLVNAARASNPGNPQLFVFCQGFGLAPATPPEPALERLVRSSNGYLDLHQWRARLGEIEAQVCRVEVGQGPGATFGTGFLVGPDLAITNHHVLRAVIEGTVDPARVILRFDYKRLASGTVVSPGTEHRLATDWLVDQSPPSAMDVGYGDADPAELDYALVRVAGAPGEAPVGKDAEPTAPLRRWIVPAADDAFAAGTPIFIVQHPKGNPIQLALDTDAVLGLNGNGTRVRYRTNTEPGSSGSPCFDQRWHLVALHHAGDPDFSFGHAAEYNEGIPFAKIVAHLRRLGVGVELPKLPD
jgi:V8-like Glu-specific endopeptidase